jgi:hypothetical protein
LHLAQRFRGVAALEHAQQPALVLRALQLQCLGQNRIVERGLRGHRRQLRGEIREEEVALVGVGGTARPVELQVRAQQPHWMVGLPGEQRVEVRGERGDRLLRRRHVPGQARGLLAFEEGDQLLELLVETRGRTQPHHRERTRGLVQVREDVLDGRALGRRGGELVERLPRLRERVVDLRLDPGKRAEIEIGDGVGGHPRV